MIDRGFIKWAPFNSVAPSKAIMETAYKKAIEPPTLSEEQIKELNEKIIASYYSKSKILLCYYEQNNIKNIETIIININANYQTIEVLNHQVIAFKQIISIS